MKRLVPLAVIAACTNPTPPDGPSQKVGLDRYVEALCDMQARFEPEIGKVTASRDECEDFWRGISVCDPRVEAATDAVLEDCADWLDGIEDYATAAARPAAACRQVWVGQTASVDGVCNPFAGELCDLDLFCKVSADSCSTCSRESAVGEACSVGNGLANYQPCGGDGFCDDGTCRAKLADDTPCTDGVDCSSGYCKAGVCTAKPGLGEACEPADLCPVRTITGQFIELPCCAGSFRSCIDGTCQDRRGPGAACATDSECLTHHSCDRGVCTYYPACELRIADEPCTSDAACSGDFYCDFNGGDPRCRDRVALGADCSRAQCDASSYCDFDDYICKAKIADGQDCSADYAECVGEMVCGPGQLCRPLGATGDSCLEWWHCESQSCDLQTETCTDPRAPQCS